MNQNKVVIAGAGTMGASLAQVYGMAGWETFLYNRSAAGLERAKGLIDLNQKTMVCEGLITSAESAEMYQHIHFTTDLEVFSDTPLVVESIIENLDSKRSFWAEISPLTPSDALLSTNTSGLSITRIAEAVVRPERFMGQHWLNPPHLLPLCEIVVGQKTEDTYVQKMYDLVSGLNKEPVIVKDISGFLANRLQFALLREALYIVENGYASCEDIDTVLKAGLGLRYSALGPLGVADFGGLDVFEKINSYLNEDLCDAKNGSALLKKLVEEGHLGVKSGKGFYDYSGDKAAQAIQFRDRMYIDLAKVLYFRKHTSSIYSRVSVRKFTDQPVEKDKVIAMIRAAMQAPSAHNQQPWEFYVVSDPEMLEKLSHISRYSSCIRNAPMAIVSAYRTTSLSAPDYPQIDMSIAMENLWLETLRSSPSDIPPKPATSRTASMRIKYTGYLVNSEVLSKQLRTVFLIPVCLISLPHIRSFTAAYLSAADTMTPSREFGILLCPAGHICRSIISADFTGRSSISFLATETESAGCCLLHSFRELYFSSRPRIPRS